MPNVHEVLAGKGSEVVSTLGQVTVHDAVGIMNEQKIGALVVVDEQKQVAGIFTERDVLRRVVGKQLDPAKTLVSQVMTQDVVCCRPNMPIDDVRVLMKQRRIRHLPVVEEDGRLAGMISIGDVNAFTANNHEVQLKYLHEYIHGRG